MKTHIISLKKEIENKKLFCLYRHLVSKDEYKESIDLLKQANYQQVDVVMNCEIWEFVKGR